MTLPTLVLGDLDLYDPDGTPYAFEVLAQGTTRGNASPVEVEMRSFLQAGAIVVTQGYTNREVLIRLAVSGGDLAALAEGEAALVAQVGIRNELTWTPHDGFGAPTVFEVVTSSLEQVDGSDEDIDEIRARPTRYYGLRLVCRAYGLSGTATTVPALSVAESPTTVNVDDGSSTSGWSGSVFGGSVTVSSAGGALTVETTTAFGSSRTLEATRLGTVDLTTTEYLVVDWKYGVPGVVLDPSSANPFFLTTSGPSLYPVTSGPSPTAGYTRTVFHVNDTLPALTFNLSTYVASGSLVRSLTIDNIDRTDNPFPSAKQQMRSLTIDGSAPTIGSIAVEHAASALGDVVFYTCPDDGSAYVPNCRAYRVSGTGGSSDSAAVSGASETLASDFVVDRPKASLPSGTYLAVARMKRSSSATATITWSAQARMNSTNIGSAETRTVSVALTTAFQFVRLGTMYLPLLDAATSASSVTRITVDGSSSETIDELYLFNIDNGRLSQVACGTSSPAAGGSSNRLWIESPSLDNDGLGRYLRGYAADQSDAYSAYPFMESVGIHEFEPPTVKVFTVTTNPTTAADVSFTYKAAWHTHAAT